MYIFFNIDFGFSELERDLDFLYDLGRCFDLERDLERDLDFDFCLNVIPFNLASFSISSKISLLSIFGYICFNSLNDAFFTNEYSSFNELNLFCDG